MRLALGATLDVKRVCLYQTGPQPGKITAALFLMVLRRFLERFLERAKNHGGFFHLLPGLASIWSRSDCLLTEPTAGVRAGLPTRCVRRKRIVSCHPCMC